MWLCRLFAVGSSLALTVVGDDWPQWGGNDPSRNMYSPAKGLPSHFHPGKFLSTTSDFDLANARNVKWVTKIGSGIHWYNPVVAGGKILIGTNNELPRDPRHQGDRSILLCLDEKTGEFLWQLVVPKLPSGKVNDWEWLGLISTPVVQSNRVYVVTTRGEVMCLTTDGLAKGNQGPFVDEGQYTVGLDKPRVEPGPKDADIVWIYDMIRELAVFPHNSSVSSPLILGDRLYVNTGNGMGWTHTNIPSPHAPSLIALDKKTGKLLARDDATIGPRILHSQWGSVSSGRVNGRSLIFFGGGDGVCYAFNAEPVSEQGTDWLKTVWRVEGNPPEYKTRTFPFLDSRRQKVLGVGLGWKHMTNGLNWPRLIRAPRQIKYPAPEGPSEFLATPVFWKNRVYIATGQDPEHGEGVGNLICIDATKAGDLTRTGILWRNKTIHRSISTASITPDGLVFIADFSGFVYCLDAETGKTFWKHDMKAHIWSSTLVADGKVYVGDEDGDLVIFSASREKRVLSKLILNGKEEDGPNLEAPIYSTPSVANGVLYIATTTHLFAIQADIQK